MSIVLPKNKNADFLAPSKNLQEAREKLGPIYFDAKLIECPKNAVELSKLLQKLEELDRRKFKALEETSRSERILLHSLNLNYSFTNSRHSLENIPDLRDIKLPPPGFRYHADGTPKLSYKLTDPKYKQEYEPPVAKQVKTSEFILENIHIPQHHQTEPLSERTLSQEDANNEEDSTRGPSPDQDHSAFVDGESKVTLANAKSKEAHPARFEVNYEKEIAELEKIIKEINEDLESNNIDLHQYSGAKGKVFTFLRAHARGDKITWQKLIEQDEFSRPNDRFVVQPGSSAFDNTNKELHKKRISNRQHGQCSACQLKLRYNHDDFKQMEKILKNEDSFLPKWNLAPRGKMVPPPTTSTIFKQSLRYLHPGQNSNSRQSSPDKLFRSTNSLQGGTRTKSSVVSPPVRCKSSSAKQYLSQGLHQVTPCAELHWQDRTSTTPTPRVKSAHVPTSSAMSPSLSKRFTSALTLTGRPKSRINNSDVALEFWKEIAAEEGQECDKKVRKFLTRLKEDSNKDLIKPKYAFL